MMALSAALILIAETMGNRAVMPAAFFYGAASGPVALLVAIHDRTGAGDTVPGGALAGMFLFGGGVALLLGGYFDSLLIRDATGPAILRVGWIEETAKFVPPLAVALTRRHLTKAAGVALGLSCATGFAIMESMSYAWRSIHRDSVVEAGIVLFVRGLTTPFSHLAWTGLICAIAFGAWQAGGRVVFTGAVTGAFAAAAVLHSLNDGLLVLDLPGPVRLFFPVVAAVSYWLFHRAIRDLTPVAAAPRPPPLRAGAADRVLTGLKDTPAKNEISG